MAHVQPFAVIRTTAFTTRRLEGFTSRYTTETEASDFLVLSLQDDAYRMAWRLAKDDAERERVVKAYIELYNDKRHNHAKFTASTGKAPTIGWKRLADWAAEPDDADMRERSWRTVPLNANWAESVRQFDVQLRPSNHDGDKLWAPRLPEMLVWLDPAAPAVLNELCARFGWEAIPFVPSKN